jgi:transposase-like protein
MIDRHAPRSIRFSITRYQHSLRDVLPYFARHDASDEGLGDAILSGKVYLSNITDCIATTYLPNGIIGQFGVRLSCSGCPTMPPLRHLVFRVVFVEMRWPDGIACPRCGHREVSFIGTRRIWKCKGCKQQFSAKVGTIMEDSPLGLDKWMAGIWLVVNAKNGISSYEIHRAIGVRQPTAWFMLQRIRYALQAESFDKFTGTVEADETYVGGKEKNKHKSKKRNAGRGAVGKAVVVGLLERHTGQARTKHVKDNKKETLHSEVRTNVEEGSALYTDAHGGYIGLAPDYVHETVNHLDEYVRGAVHTNSLENYWTLFKRCYGGTWTHLSDDHLHRYLVEQEFRFNNRLDVDGVRFTGAVAMAPGKRLTYKELIGRED